MKWIPVLSKGHRILFNRDLVDYVYEYEGTAYIMVHGEEVGHQVDGEPNDIFIDLMNDELTEERVEDFLEDKGYDAG